MANHKETKRSAWRIRLLYLIWRRWVKPLSPERRGEVQVQLREDSRPDFGFFLLVILSSIIATQGLLVNSAAVIIGAMLVAPLMTPIIAIGLASITGETRMLRDSASALIRGALLAILVSALITFVNRYLPFIVLQDLPNEVIARTHPNPIDLGVALAGGVAAAFALSMPDILAALPGVAIATALMPPLCTIGIGLSLGRLDVAAGATVLFITNTIAIAFASSLVYYALGFSGPLLSRAKGVPRTLILSALVTVVLFGSLTYYSYQLVQSANKNREIEVVLRKEIASIPGAELVEWNATSDGETLNLTIVIRTLTMLNYEDSVQIQKSIAAQLQQPVAVEISQVFAARLNPLIPPTPTSTPTATFTFTPGPSPTNTPTRTPTPTFTPTLTATSTATATPTDTPTPTLTPTPRVAKVVNTAVPGLRLLQYPGGPPIAVLRSGQQLTILYGKQVAYGLVWVEVMDKDGRKGWVPEIYLQVLTPTPTSTPSVTPTPRASATPSGTPAGVGLPTEALPTPTIALTAESLH